MPDDSNSASHITVAIDRYDRHLPLLHDMLRPSSGPPLQFLEVGMVPPRRHGVDRHRRMLVDQEFDIAEVSLASYLVARDQGLTDLILLPIFPRRLFSYNHIFVREGAGIEVPRDLLGRRVIIWAFQVTMSVLAKGDLKRDHAIDWREIDWLTQRPEEIPIDLSHEVRIHQTPPDSNPFELLRSGAADAYINPHPAEKIMTPGSGIRRLFPDWQQTTRSYFERYGYFPVMHALAVKPAILERVPDLPSQLFRLFSEAKALARDFYVDPGFSMVMHCRNTLEFEVANYSHDAWADGLEKNRSNLEDFLDFCLDQGLLATRPSLDEVFPYPL